MLLAGPTVVDMRWPVLLLWLGQLPAIVVVGQSIRGNDPPTLLLAAAIVSVVAMLVGTIGLVRTARWRLTVRLLATGLSMFCSVSSYGILAAVGSMVAYYEDLEQQGQRRRAGE